MGKVRTIRVAFPEGVGMFGTGDSEEEGILEEEGRFSKRVGELSSSAQAWSGAHLPCSPLP